MGARRRSVRFRITVLAVGVFVVVAAAGGVAVVLLQRNALLETFDDTIEQRTHGIADRLGREGLAAIPERGDDVVAQLVTDDGAVVASSDIIADRTRPVAEPPAGRVAVSATDVEPLGSVRIRSVRVGPVPGAPDAAILHVIGSVDDVDEAVTALVGILAAGTPLVVAALGATVWWSVGRTLQPVEAIRSEVATFGDGRWNGRVPEPGTGDEIDRLARTMNEMLGRLEQSVERQRRFVGDASHELRSPLTRLRADIEVALSHPGSDLRVTLADSLDDVIELSALVDDLLVLARLDADLGLPADEVDLDVVVTAVLRPHRDDRRVTVDGSGITAGRVVGDERLLQRAVDNLVRNAMRHAASKVWIAVHETADEAVVEVSDDGPGVPAHERQRIFERFTRLDDARARDAGGTGLGLAISHAVAARHEGTIEVDDSPAGGARFRIRLPRSDEI